MKYTVAFEFTITSSTLNSRLKREIPVNPEYELRCRVLAVNDRRGRLEVHTAGVNRFGEPVWVQLDDDGRVEVPVGSDKYGCMLSCGDIQGYAIARLAELAMEHVQHRTAGDFDVLDLGVL